MTRASNGRRNDHANGVGFVPSAANDCDAERPNHVWAIDFQFDETTDQRRLKLANIVDEHTREALAMRVGPSLHRRGSHRRTRTTRARVRTAELLALRQRARAHR